MSLSSSFIPSTLARDAKTWRREARRLLQRADRIAPQDPIHATALRDDANLLVSLATEAEDTARSLACAWLIALPADAN